MIPRVYIHRKTGEEYLVLSEVINTGADGEVMMMLYTPYAQSAKREPWYVLGVNQFFNLFKEKDNG